jgi:hypothetical protein
LLLCSELKGKIDFPEYYFDNNNTDAALAVTNLMLTQGWRKFSWEDILQNKKQAFKFLPELEGQAIEGKITDKTTGGAVPDIKSYLSIPDHNFIFNASISDHNGDIMFPVKKLYGLNDIILQTNNQKDSIYKIDINNPFTNKFSFLPLPLFSLSKKWENDLINRSINVQAENTYLSDKKLHTFHSLKTDDTTGFYGFSDKEYYLDNYTRFVTMEEVIKEYIPEIRLRNHNNGFQLRLMDISQKKVFDNNPLLLLDGVPVFNTNKIISFDPLKIKKIELVEQKYFLGNFIWDGVISFKTYEGDLGGYQLDPNAIILEFDGLQQQRKFYSPLYENNEQLKSRIPDFRNQLFWLPQLKTNSGNKTQLSFYTSDLTGKYIIVIQGITKTGLSGSKTITFDVVLPKNSGTD